MTHPIGTPYDSMGARMSERKDVNEVAERKVVVTDEMVEAAIVAVEQRHAPTDLQRQLMRKAIEAALAACTPAKEEGR